MLFVAPSCPWPPLSCQETFDLLSSSFFPFPNSPFACSYHAVLFPISLLFLPTSPLSLLSLRSYHYLSVYAPLCPSCREIVSPSRLLFVGARCLNRGLILLPPSPFTSPLSKLASPVFPLRHLPRAILPPSTCLAHPAVVLLRYSPFCPRGTSNAEAQVCKMAAVCWSFNATRTLLRFDGSKEDAMRKQEGQGEEDRERTTSW